MQVDGNNSSSLDRPVSSATRAARVHRPVENTDANIAETLYALFLHLRSSLAARRKHLHPTCQQCSSNAKTLACHHGDTCWQAPSSNQSVFAKMFHRRHILATKTCIHSEHICECERWLLQHLHRNKNTSGSFGCFKVISVKMQISHRVWVCTRASVCLRFIVNYAEIPLKSQRHEKT